jgi:hypothetical protein
MITFGFCQFKAAEGAYKCSCEAGSYVSVISGFRLTDIVFCPQASLVPTQGLRRRYRS